MNSIPIISQIKSVVLMACGDHEGAGKVHEDFINTCPVVSQLKSAVHLARGDVSEAINTQVRGVGFLSSLADSIPVVGHIKGAIHYAVGDHIGGENAMVAATRTSAVIGCGMAGSIGGPVGMIAGGIAGGAAVDATATAMKSSFDSDYSPVGIFETIEELKETPTAGGYFDAAAGIVLDGFAGFSAGSVDNGPGKLTRTQWRNVLRKNAKARAAGHPVPAVRVHVTVTPSPAGAASATLATASRDNHDDSHNGG